MRNKIKLLPAISLGISFALTLMYCSPVSLQPTQIDVNKAKNRWANIDLAKLNDGYNTYNDKCGKCHRLKKPYRFTEEKLKKIVPIMAHKAHIDINSEKYDHLLKFMLTMRYKKSDVMTNN